jgi:hypothetical protein
MIEKSPVFYTRPTGDRVRLGVQPALASWDKAGSPGQARSAAFIDHVFVSVADQIARTSDPLALRLDVGLPDNVSLLTFHDLDNYLFPLVPKLAERSGRQFASVWATKRHTTDSFVAVSRAVAADGSHATNLFEVTTSASASTTAYKKEIRDQLADARPMPGGAIALQLAFVVGPRRAWTNLWKATIDSLGAILGHDHGAREWHPQDGRITDLGLHCVVDPTAGNNVRISIRASNAQPNRRPGNGGQPRWKRRSPLPRRRRHSP